MDFWQKLPDTICVRKGEKRVFSLQLSVLAKIVFWTKTVQSRKHYKNRGFSGICQKAKMTPFFGKGCFLTWLKKWVLLTVFLKAAKHSFSKTKTVCWKKQKIYENLWVVFEHGKMVFFGFVFWGFNIKRFVFGVSWPESGQFRYTQSRKFFVAVCVSCSVCCFTCACLLGVTNDGLLLWGASWHQTHVCTIKRTTAAMSITQGSCNMDASGHDYLSLSISLWLCL